MTTPITATYASVLLSTYGFGLKSFVRQTAQLRSSGLYVPGLDGYQTQLAIPSDRNALELVLIGHSDDGESTLDDLRTLICASQSYRSLVFSDLSPLFYSAQGRYVKQAAAHSRGADKEIEIGFLVSPPCLLGATVTDSSSPVANAGDYACPATWTITAAGNFTLTVGAITAVWTGGAGTVVINSATFAVTKGGVAAPQYLRGGYPWLLPGNNTVSLTAGSTFSCSFNPRYA